MSLIGDDSDEQKDAVDLLKSILNQLKILNFQIKEALHTSVDIEEEDES